MNEDDKKYVRSIAIYDIWDENERQNRVVYLKEGEVSDMWFYKQLGKVKAIYFADNALQGSDNIYITFENGMKFWAGFRYEITKIAIE